MGRYRKSGERDRATTALPAYVTQESNAFDSKDVEAADSKSCTKRNPTLPSLPSARDSPTDLSPATTPTPTDAKIIQYAQEAAPSSSSSCEAVMTEMPMLQNHDESPASHNGVDVEERKI